ncbi:MAG TPA: gluconokinase [Kofleriaceae bacterium]|nr:gluconokinase [Kofleriaceae bacterium]
MRPLVVVMGVAGSGKTTVGALLAERLGLPFADADSFHPPANLAKMAAGQPLTDEDRAPWLAAIGAWLDERAAAGTGGVATCSALKRAYRDRLRAGRPRVQLVYLSGSRELLAARLAGRTGHFFPPSLLASQLADLEEPQPDEGAIAVAIDPPPGVVVDAIVAALARRAGAP